METLDTLTKSFDKLFITTAQNILGSDIKICKWSFIFTSIGVGLGLIINSFYFFKIHNENKLIKNKLDLLLNNQKVIIEGNITIYEYMKNNVKGLEITVHDKNIHLEEREIEKDDSECEGYDLLYYE
jgi:hypothetical protein